MSVCFMRSGESRNYAPGEECEFDIVHCVGSSLQARSRGNGVRILSEGTYRVELRGYVLPMAPGDIVCRAGPLPCGRDVKGLCEVSLHCDTVRPVGLGEVLCIVPCKNKSIVSVSFRTPVTLLSGATVAVTRVI